MAADYGAFDDAPAAAESVPEIGVTVRIVQARNLVGLSGPNQPFNALVSTKLLAEHAIETPPVMTADGGVHRFDHSTTLSFPHDALVLNQLIAQPLSFSLAQVEGKAGDRVVIGTAELRLDGLLREPSLEQWITITARTPPRSSSQSRRNSRAATPGAAAGGDEAQAVAELCVAIELSHPLVDPDELDEDDGRKMRVLEVNLGSLQSLPARWLLPPGTPVEAHPYVYSATTSIPLGGGKEYTLTFPGGTLVLPRSASFDAGAPAGAPGVEAAAAEPLGAAAPPPEEGAPAGAPAGEAEAQMIVWPAASSARCILPAAAAEHLKELLASGARLKLHVARELAAPDAMTEPASNALKYRGVCEADLRALVELDATSATARCRVQPEIPVDEEEAAAAAAAAAEANAAAAKEAGAAGAKDDKGAAKAKGGGAKDKEKGKKGDDKKGGKPEAKTELPAEDPEFPHPYTAAGTELVLSISTDLPLFPRPPPPPPPVPKPSDLIPRRVLPSLQPRSANQEFEVQVRAVVASLLSEFSRMFADAPLTDESDEARAERRRQLLYELNNSGAYFSLKERLKKAVVRIVRESFHKTDESQMPEGGEADRLHAELYMHLVGLAHKALHAHFFGPPPGAPPPPGGGGEGAFGGVPVKGASVRAAMGDPPAEPAARAPIIPTAEPRLDQLRRLADEFETDRLWDAAAAIHEERMCLSEHDGALWRDYALFLLRAGRWSKAEAALREALSIDSADAASLTAYGATLFSREKADEAEVFVKGAVDAQPESAVAWALLGVLCSALGRDYDGRKAFKQAASLSPSPESLRVEAAEALLPLCAEPLIEVALTLQTQHEHRNDSSATESVRVRFCRARAHLAVHRYDEAAIQLGAISAEQPERADVLAALGHAHLGAGREADALSAYTACLERDPHCRDAAVLLRASQLSARAAERSPPGQQQVSLWQAAHDAALRACKHAPSASAWLAAGVACHALHLTQEAEEALSESCVLNNRSPHVWAHLCLLALELDRTSEAEQSLAQALRLGLNDAPLLERMGGAYLAAGEWPTAERCLRRALATVSAGAEGEDGEAEGADQEKAAPSVAAAAASPAAGKAGRLLADALAEQGKADEAIELYEAALTQPRAPEAEVRHIKQRLSSLNAATGRA